MESEGGLQVVRRVAFAQFQVVPQQLFVHGVNAVLDDGVSALDGRFAAEVGYALLGDEHLYRVFAVVEVRNHGHNGADFAAFGRRGAGEYREVGVAGEVGRAADTVHHLGAGYVG